MKNLLNLQLALERKWFGITIITNDTLLLFKWGKEVKDMILNKNTQIGRLGLTWRTLWMLNSPVV